MEPSINCFLVSRAGVANQQLTIKQQITKGVLVLHPPPPWIPDWIRWNSEVGLMDWLFHLQKCSQLPLAPPANKDLIVSGENSRANAVAVASLHSCRNISHRSPGTLGPEQVVTGLRPCLYPRTAVQTCSSQHIWLRRRRRRPTAAATSPRLRSLSSLTTSRRPPPSCQSRPRCSTHMMGVFSLYGANENC